MNKTAKRIYEIADAGGEIAAAIYSFIFGLGFILVLPCLLAYYVYRCITQ